MKSENKKNNLDIEDPKQESSNRWHIVKDHKKVICIVAFSALLVIIIVAVVTTKSSPPKEQGMNIQTKVTMNFFQRFFATYVQKKKTGLF